MPVIDSVQARCQGSALRVVCLLTLLASPLISFAAEKKSPTEQVFEVERSFARTMADRSLADFSRFLADEAVFFAATKPLRGKTQVIEAWSKYFAEPTPPFSWEPDQVEVLASGSLALSTGPVRDPSGKVVGRFNTIWRLEAPGTWRVVFDKGSPASPGPK